MTGLDDAIQKSHETYSSPGCGRVENLMGHEEVPGRPETGRSPVSPQAVEDALAESANELNRANDRVRALEAALEKYGRHEGVCYGFRNWPHECDCGLLAVKKNSE